MSEKLPKDYHEGWQNILAGSIGGVAMIVSTQPLEIAKFYLQTRPLGTYTGFIHAIRSIGSNFGIRGLYAGGSVAMTSECISGSLEYAAFKAIRREFSHHNVPNIIADGIAGLLAGALEASVQGPFELVKARMQDNPAEVFIVTNKS